MQLTYLEAIRQGIWEEMDRDPTVFCLGEDIGIYGGAFKVTDGFIDRFGPERVIDTPIAESAIVGAAFGASLNRHASRCRIPVHGLHRLRLQSDLQHGCKDSLSLGCARSARPARTQRRIRPRWPISLAESRDVVRPQSWAKSHLPSDPYDAKGLIKAAIRDNNPCIFFEHKYLYRRIKGDVPTEDYVVPIGKARIVREGRDLSIITYAAMVHTALEAAEILKKDGIDLEILDLRTRLAARPRSHRADREEDEQSHHPARAFPHRRLGRRNRRHH